MNINKNRVVDKLIEMIKIDSTSYNEKPMSDYLEKYFKDKGLDVYRDNAGEKFGGNGSNVLVHIPGTMNGNPICFNAHQDTVSLGIGIVPVLKDGIISSEGNTILAGDDKAGIVSIMEAYDYIVENNISHREMYFLFTICEEQNMMGIKNFEFSKLPCKDVFVIDAPGSPGKISLAGPAKVGIVAQFSGKKAHAGIEPENGISAPCMLAKAISSVKFGRIDDETTSNIGRIEGGGQTNVVSEDAMFTMEIRSRNAEKLNAQVEIIKKSCEQAAEQFGGTVEIVVSHDYPEIKLDKESFVYTQLIKAYQKEGIEVVYGMAGGGGDSNIMAGHGYKCCGIGCGMYNVHSTDESLNLSELYSCINITIHMMTE